MYIVLTGYNSYIFKPKSWLHNIPIKLKVSFFCIITYIIISFNYGILLGIYFLCILIVSSRYQYKVYSKEIKKITASSIFVSLPLIICLVIEKTQKSRLEWVKTYYISICFQVFILVNVIFYNFMNREEVAYYFSKIYKQFNNFKLIFITSNNFLRILDKKIEVLIYNWYNRDLIINKNNIYNIQKVILYSLQFIIFELYYETIKFALTIYLRKSKIYSSKNK